MKRLFMLVSLIVISSCSKKLLDFTSDTSYTVKQVLRSKNCNVKCRVTASCEEKEVQIIGVIDEYNINKEDNQFFLLEPKSRKYSIEVKVASETNHVVFTKLRGKGGKFFVVKGVIKGFDVPMNFNCDKRYTMKLTNINNLIPQ